MNHMVFDDESADKASRTLEFLETFHSHPEVKGRVCLHGGTALNLFVLTPERLSLDADINYIGTCATEELPQVREVLENAILAVARELGYDSRAGRGGHAGRTFKLMYDSPITGSRDFIKADLDYINRTPVLSPKMAASKLEGPVIEFPINAPVEIVAGKLKAICERVVPRDLYDIGRIARTRTEWSTGDEELDHALMIFYFALSSSFPKPQDILVRFDGRESDIEAILWPVLPVEMRPTLNELQKVVLPFLSWATLPQNDQEAAFLTSLSMGDYRPELLFGSYPDALQNANTSPAMKWKLKNLRAGIDKGLVKPLHLD